MTEPTNEEVKPEEPVEDIDEVNEILPVRFTITSYGADYPVDGLVKRMAQGDIHVPLFSLESGDSSSAVAFQREFVWKKTQADRFIESLLLGLPVPGIFLVKEASGRLLVLDGQQRLRTLQSFYDGVFQGKEFRLENVQDQWKKKTYKTLGPDDRRRLDDTIIHATIVRQDEPSEDQSSIYLVFERLNSGGTFLQPQEIRVALYHGEFARVLNQLNDNRDWRTLYGRKSIRLKDIELILRFFALYFSASSYHRPMKEFLNKYMAGNRKLQRQSEAELREIFEPTVSAILRAIGRRAFRPKGAVNAAVLDSVVVGVASRLARSPITSDKELRDAYDKLLGRSDYQEVTTRSTADEEYVRKRLQLATNTFSEVP